MSLDPNVDTQSTDTADAQPVVPTVAPVDFGRTGIPQDSGAPRPPYNGPTQQNSSMPTAPDFGATEGPTTAGSQPGSFGDRLGSALRTNAANPAAPAIMSSPGGFSKMMIGSTLDAISGAMGDAAHKPVPGGGWLSGVTATLGARSTRLANARQQTFQNNIEQQKADASVAYTQALSIQLAHNTYRQDEADRRTDYATGKSFVGDLRANHDTQDNVSQNDLNKMLADDPSLLKSHYAVATGELPELGADGKPQVDDKGNVVHSPIYSVIDRTPNQTEKNIPVTQKMHDYWLANTGTNVPVGTNTLGIDDIVGLQKKAQIVDGVTTAIDKANGEKMSSELNNQLLVDKQAVASYVAKYPNDPLKGLNEEREHLEGGVNDKGAPFIGFIPQLQQQIAALSKAPQTPDTQQKTADLQGSLKQLQDEQKSLNNIITFGFSDDAKQKYAKQATDAQKATNETLKDAATAEEAKQHGALYQAQANALDHPLNSGTNVPVMPEVQSKINSLPVPQQNMLRQYDSNTQAALMSIAFGNGEVDLEKNFPASGPRKGVPGLTTQQALGVIQQLNGDWSEQSYGVKRNLYKSATTGPLSQQSGSLNNFIGHAAEAQRVADKFYNASPKIFKQPLNAVEKGLWGADVVSLGEAIQVVNGEFNNMIKSGFAPTSDESNAQAALVNPASTVGQINAAMKVMGHMADTRANTMNQQYRNGTGADFPNLIYPDNVNDARKLGMRVDKYRSGGQIGGSGNAPQMRNDQTGQQIPAQQPTQGGSSQQQPPAGVAAGSIGVQTPDNQTHWFKTQAEADNFKKLAKVQ